MPTGIEGDLARNGTLEESCHPSLCSRCVWQGWRRNVKARLFVMTLRDNFSETPTRTSAAVATALGKDPNDPQRTDDWALAYISITHLQPIMEAFDDDGSGYITVTEVNRFIDALPPSIHWRCVISNFSTLSAHTTMQPSSLDRVLGNWYLILRPSCG